MYGALSKAQPPKLDELIDELDRRLDPYDSASFRASADWWKEYRNRERRASAANLLAAAATNTPGEAGSGRFLQLTNAIRDLSVADVEPILREVETKVTAKDPKRFATCLPGMRNSI